jgi:hypothetical protein
MCNKLIGFSATEKMVRGDRLTSLLNSLLAKPNAIEGLGCEYLGGHPGEDLDL